MLADTDPAEDGAASLDVSGACAVVQPENAKPTASGAIRLKLDICKADASLREALFLFQKGGKYRQRPQATATPPAWRG